MIAPAADGCKRSLAGAVVTSYSIWVPVARCLRRRDAGGTAHQPTRPPDGSPRLFDRVWTRADPARRSRVN